MLMNKFRVHNVHGFETLIDAEATPTQNHQIFEELLQKEKELGAMLMLQRDFEGRFP